MAAIDAERALGLIGRPFRPQGRDERGMDCVGLCIAAFGLPTAAFRSDYRLSGNHRTEIETALRIHFRKVRKAERRPGDVLLLMVAEGQPHLAILTEGGFVHADARLRRVVETPGEPEWPLVAVYRRRKRPRREIEWRP